MPEHLWALAVVVAFGLAFVTYLIGLRSVALGLAPALVRRAQCLLWVVSLFIFCALATAGLLVGYDVTHARPAEWGRAAVPAVMAVAAGLGLVRYLRRALRLRDPVEPLGEPPETDEQ